MNKNLSKKPVIGIVLDSAINSVKYQYSDFPWYALKQKYAEVVAAAGGVPIMLHYEPDLIPYYLELIDGIIIPGGDEDINPKFYGEIIKSDKVRTNDQRASFELAITKKILAMQIPFLGICNGMQVLNVALGGTLIQHIPDMVKSAINHEQPAPKHVPSHIIHIKPNTKIHSLTDKDELYVMSTHHQAVGTLGSGLIIAAVAPDGIIEAIESINHDFAIGVEWHPEYLETNPLDFNLFKELISKSAQFLQKRS